MKPRICILGAILCILMLTLFSKAHSLSPAGLASFTVSDLVGIELQNPTSLQFGPDNRLYISQQNGLVSALTITRNGRDDYIVTDTETIDLVQKIPNHNDDGSLAEDIVDRQVLGIHVAGTPENPILYVSSSDPRIGAGAQGLGDVGLDTNSGVISQLTWNGAEWEKIDVVRGLPRSEQNHATNGMQLDADQGILYVAQGGHTNAGAPSTNFAYLSEYALSAAILSIDLNVIDALPTRIDSENQRYKYNLPTLSDLTGITLPWGGDDGLNQALLIPGGPVQVYSPGYRNPYDLILTKTPGRQGRLYTVDNGANFGWGGYPENEGSPPDSNCTNNYVPGEPGMVNNKNGLHFISEQGYYGGHPNPIRGNPDGAGLYLHDTTGAFILMPTPTWPPIPPFMANPIECDFLMPNAGPGTDEPDSSLITFQKSTNGLTEYTASTFNRSMQGDLLLASFSGEIYYAELNDAGDAVLNGVGSFASGFGDRPIDVIAQGDDDIFPGTIWVASYGSSSITIFEPDESVVCTGEDSNAIDEDNDRYTNSDEIDNGTNLCSAASKPDDYDKSEINGFLVSDLNDPDDDDDGLSDTIDPFALDATNGRMTAPPLLYHLFNNNPGFGIEGLGFTGLMSNGDDYLTLLDPSENVVFGGTAGLLTVPLVSSGDAIQQHNSQENGLQFGIQICDICAPYTFRTRLREPFFNGLTPQDFQSLGFYIGTGDQDNYLKLVISANTGLGGIQLLFEEEGQVMSNQKQTVSRILDHDVAFVDLFLTLDPASGSVQAEYKIDGDQGRNEFGTPVVIPKDWWEGSQSLAVGVIATSFGSETPFSATWDVIDIRCESSDGRCGSTNFLPITSISGNSR